MTDERPDSYVLTVDEVAHRLQVSKSSVHRLVNTGILPSIRVGRSVRVPKMAFERWFEQQTRRRVA